MFLYIIQTVCFPIPWSALLGQAWADDSQSWVMTSEGTTRSVCVGIAPDHALRLAAAADLANYCLRVDSSNTSRRKGNLRRPRTQHRLQFAYTNPIFIMFLRLPSQPAFLSPVQSNVCLPLRGYRIGEERASWLRPCLMVEDSSDFINPEP